MMILENDKYYKNSSIKHNFLMCTQKSFTKKILYTLHTGIKIKLDYLETNF